ncbi:MAG: PIN domain-containing protein [Gemmatimonadetes bacterium]|nr:PIN domain-containing protein [Gemmatimonadota bacterium]
MIVADTGALFALLHVDEPPHAEILSLYNDDPDAWVLPWAILPELDYLLETRGGAGASQVFLAELANGAWAVEWGAEGDMERAHELNRQYQALKLGLVDGVVMAIAERLKAEAIATLDLKHFGAVKIAGAPRLLPRDL